jgi:hypothetical protein
MDMFSRNGLSPDWPAYNPANPDSSRIRVNPHLYAPSEMHPTILIDEGGPYRSSSVSSGGLMRGVGLWGDLLGVWLYWEEWLNAAERGKKTILTMEATRSRCDQVWAHLKQNHPRYFAEGCPACCVFSYERGPLRSIQRNDGLTSWVRDYMNYQFVGFEQGACSEVLEARPKPVKPTSMSNAGWYYYQESGYDYGNQK